MASLYQLGGELLDDLVAALGPSYSRAYVHVGAIAGGLLCGQVVVSWQGMRVDRPAVPAGSAMRTPQQPAMPVAFYEVRVTDCVPGVSNDGQPTAAQLDAAARRQLDMVAVVWRVVWAWARERDCTLVSLDPMTPVGPQGVEGGVSWRVAVAVSSGLQPSGS